MILPRKMTESLIKYPFADIDYSCCTQLKKYWKDHWFGKKQNLTRSLGIFSKSSILALSFQLKRSLLDLQPVWKDVWWIDFQNRWSQSTAGAVVSRTGYQTYKTFRDRNAQILQNIKKKCTISWCHSPWPKKSNLSACAVIVIIVYHWSRSRRQPS